MMVKIVRPIKRLVKQALYLLGVEHSINWEKRVKQYGLDSIYDCRTVIRGAQSIETKRQIALYSPLIIQEVRGLTVKRVLDYGCGAGRFFEMLSQLGDPTGSIEVYGFDPTASLLTFAEGIGYAGLYDSLDMERSYDLIFVHMVLGGLSDAEVRSFYKSLDGLLALNGRCIIVEATDEESPIFHGPWRVRPLNGYLLEGVGLNWRVLGASAENNTTMTVISATRA